MPAGTSVAAQVAVTGHVAERGTRGPILVFAFTDLARREGPADARARFGRHARGRRQLRPHRARRVAASTLAFLADGSNDGVIDGGDPVAVLHRARRSPT